MPVKPAMPTVLLPLHIKAHSQQIMIWFLLNASPILHGPINIEMDNQAIYYVHLLPDMSF